MPMKMQQGARRSWLRSTGYARIGSFFTLIGLLILQLRFFQRFQFCEDSKILQQSNNYQQHISSDELIKMSDAQGETERKNDHEGTLALKPSAAASQHITRPHPHEGAQDANGKLGYIVNPTTRRLHLNSTFIQSKLLNTCNKVSKGDTYGPEGVGGYQVLQKIRLGTPFQQAKRLRTNSIPGTSSPRILCMVYTYEKRHESYLRSIIDTWGNQCDGFFAASNITDDSMGAINLAHFGPEQYDNMWQKIRSMWAYAFDHYLMEYDYFHICGDDTYVIVDNLRSYLGSEEVQQLLNGTKTIFSKAHERVNKVWKGNALNSEGNQNKFNTSPATREERQEQRPLLFGMPCDGEGLETFPCGGCGYTLNRAALSLFATTCLSNYRDFDIDSREDLLVGQCLGQKSGVYTVDTRDKNGAWRYHAQDAEFQYQFTGILSPWRPRFMKRKHEITSLAGLDGASEESVAFHLKPIKKEEDDQTIIERMYSYHAILEGVC